MSIHLKLGATKNKRKLMLTSINRYKNWIPLNLLQRVKDGNSLPLKNKEGILDGGGDDVNCKELTFTDVMDDNGIDTEKRLEISWV